METMKAETCTKGEMVLKRGGDSVVVCYKSKPNVIYVY